MSSLYPWCDSTMSLSMPRAASSSAAFCTLKAASLNTMLLPGLEMNGVSSVVRPMIPTSCPSRRRTVYGSIFTACSCGSALKSTLEETIVNLAFSSRLASSTGGPLSNSWLPRVATSSFIKFQNSVSAAPWNWVKYSVPWNMSPECRNRTLGACRRRASTADIKLGKPPSST